MSPGSRCPIQSSFVVTEGSDEGLDFGSEVSFSVGFSWRSGFLGSIYGRGVAQSFTGFPQLFRCMILLLIARYVGLNVSMSL